MKPNEVVMLILAITTGLLIPLIVFLVRGAVKWTRVEAKMDHAITELKKIVEDKDKVHEKIYQQIQEDRKATNDRLRWLEEHLWNHDSSSASRRRTT